MQEQLDIDGLKKIQVPLHMHCGELVIPDVRSRARKLQRQRKRTLQVEPPPLFQFSLKALELEWYLEQRLKTEKDNVKRGAASPIHPAQNNIYTNKMVASLGNHSLYHPITLFTRRPWDRTLLNFCSGSPPR